MDRQRTIEIQAQEYNCSPSLRSLQPFRQDQMKLLQMNAYLIHFLYILFFTILMADRSLCIRIPDRISEGMKDTSNQPLNIAVFALGSFWRSEAVFGCLDGVVRTTVGYAGGSKTNPEYRSLGDHAESVQIEYDPWLINFRQLLEVFWSSHDSRQVFGQGPDVGNQYRSIIFTNGTEETRLAAVGKEREQTKSKSSVVTTQIQQLGIFYPAEPEHQRSNRQVKRAKIGTMRQSGPYGICVPASIPKLDPKFELKRSPFLLQLIGNMPEEELERSSLAAKLNGYAAELCPIKIQKQIDAKINDIIRKGWPILRDI